MEPENTTPEGGAPMDAPVAPEAPAMDAPEAPVAPEAAPEAPAEGEASAM